MSLLAIGTVAFDEVETPFGKSGKIIGGSGTYIALASSYFTNKSKLVGVVGDDFRKEDLEMMQKHGVDTKGVQVKEGEKSFFWSGRYHADLNTRDTLATELNVLAEFDPVIPESYQDCEYLMLGNLTPSVQKTVLNRLNNRPKLVVMDTMNFWMTEPFIEELKEVIGMVDVLSINDEEARLLSDEYSLVKAARKIRKMGPKYLIIKKGEHGALLFGDEEIFFAPALPLEDVFDPTGAGDTFAGGFIGHLASTGDISFDNMKRGIIYGSAMASFCVEKFGPERIVGLTPEELEERVQEFINLVQFEIEYS